MLKLQFKRASGGWDVVFERGEGQKPILVGRMGLSLNKDGRRYDLQLATVPGRQVFVFGYDLAREIFENALAEVIEQWLSRMAEIAQKDDEPTRSWNQLQQRHLDYKSAL